MMWSDYRPTFCCPKICWWDAGAPKYGGINQSSVCCFETRLSFIHFTYYPVGRRGYCLFHMQDSTSLHALFNSRSGSNFTTLIQSLFYFQNNNFISFQSSIPPLVPSLRFIRLVLFVLFLTLIKFPHVQKQTQKAPGKRPGPVVCKLQQSYNKTTAKLQQSYKPRGPNIGFTQTP